MCSRVRGTRVDFSRTANKFLTWQAVRYAKQAGIRDFDMGGYYVGGERAREIEGVNVFKASFGGKLSIRYGKITHSRTESPGGCMMRSGAVGHGYGLFG